MRLLGLFFFLSLQFISLLGFSQVYQEFETNQLNLHGLASTACMFYMNKGEHETELGQFATHQWSWSKSNSNMHLAGTCNDQVMSADVDLNQFSSQDNPLIQIYVGSWVTKFRFESVRQVQNGQIRISKALMQAIFRRSIARDSIINTMGFGEFAEQAMESINTSNIKLSFEKGWSSREQQELHVKASGLLFGVFRMYSSGANILMKLSDTYPQYQISGDGGDTALADGVVLLSSYVPGFAQSCTNYIVGPSEQLTAEMCANYLAQPRPR